MAGEHDRDGLCRLSGNLDLGRREREYDIDILANQLCRINLNVQCQRGPDSFPFTGRKDSAEGTLSVTDALRVFSIRAMVAVKEGGEQIVSDMLMQRTSKFVRTDFLF